MNLDDHPNHPDHLTTLLNELNRPQIDRSQPPINSDEQRGGGHGERGLWVGHHNFWSIVLHDLWSKTICRPGDCLITGATFILDVVIINMRRRRRRKIVMTGNLRQRCWHWHHWWWVVSVGSGVQGLHQLWKWIQLEKDFDFWGQCTGYL